jgi:putative nucleotidyltransferase with HDIG domain
VLRPATLFVYYKNLIVFVGSAIFIGALVHMGSDTSHLPELAIFFVIILISELIPVRCPGTDDDVTMTIPAIISLFLSHGASAALCISSLGIFAGAVVSHRSRKNVRWLLHYSAYNTALSILLVALAFWSYQLFGGRTLQAGQDTAITSMILPLFIAVTVLTTANILTFTVGAAMYSGQPWRLLLAQSLGWFTPNLIITAPSGILFAQLYKQFGIYGVLLIIIPFIVGRQALNVYSEQIAAYLETVTTLGSYMQHYHPYTKGHLERVANMSDRIAKHMGLPYQSLMFIREAGLLHDIGKVGVSEETLDKVGQLSDEDWATIKQHPARGAEILAQMEHFERIVPWVRGHHERPDGRGYPDGLKGDAITIEAAVIAVADAFDAMTGGPEEKDQRVYRVPLTIDQGIDQVRYGAGTQFDPRVVRAFMQVMEREEAENGN